MSPSEQLEYSCPINNGEVLIWDMDGSTIDFGNIDDDIIGIAFTDDSGYYSSFVINVDDDGGGIEAYTTIHANNYINTVTPGEKFDAYWYYSGVHNEMTDGSIIDLGDWWYYTPSLVERYSGAPFYIFNEINSQHGWILENTQVDIPKIDTWYPTDTISCFITTPKHIELDWGNGWEEETIAHEYGHDVMWEVYNHAWPTGATISEHSMVSISSPGFALSEGWAEFFSASKNNNASSFDSFYKYNWLNNIPDEYLVSIEYSGLEDSKYERFVTIDPWDGNMCEGSVASILWDIYDGADAIDCHIIEYSDPIGHTGKKETYCSDNVDIITADDYNTEFTIEPTYNDGLHMGIAPILDVMRNYRPIPNDIYDFWDGWFSSVGATAVIRNTLINRHWMKAIYYNHGVNPNIKGYPETCPAPFLSMIIENPTQNAAYSNTITLKATQVTDLDSEDRNFLECIFEYFPDYNGNGIADEDPNGNGIPNDRNDWIKISESTTNSETDRTEVWNTTIIPDGNYLLRVTVNDDMLETVYEYPVKPVQLRNLPKSSIARSGVYWRNTNPITITASATDNDGVQSVCPYYRYSANNVTWSAWTLMATSDNIVPYVWSFTMPNLGYYEFRSLAYDVAGNWEEVPTTADAAYGFDNKAPVAPTTLSPTTSRYVTGTPSPISFTWNSIVNDPAPITGYSIVIDGATYSASINSYTKSLAVGTHTWKARATSDKAGNPGTWSTTITFTISLETTPGNVGGHVYSSSGAPIAGATITSFAETPQDIGGGNTINSVGAGNLVFATVTSGADGGWGMSLTSNVQYSFIASKAGYNNGYGTAYVPPSGGASLNFYLSTSSSGEDDGVGGGGGGGGGCLIAGTRIATPQGDENVEDITEGDEVYSYNEMTGAVEVDVVDYATTHSDFAGYLLINGHLGITEEHPVYTTDGLLNAGDLSVGSVMITMDGNEVITSIVRVPELTTLYNFEVGNNHNYYANDVLVHNVCTLVFGCPFVYTWNGEKFAQENNILPQSTKPDRTMLDVSDSYVIQGTVAPIGDTYSFQLYEPAVERTQLDAIELAVIDYNEEMEIAVTSDGEIKAIVDPTPPESCIDDYGTESLELVDEMNDGMQMKLEHNETLTVWFTDDVSEAPEMKMAVYHKAIVEVLPYAIPVDPRYYKCSIHVQVQDGDGWRDFASIPARLNKVLDVVDITPLKDYIVSGNPIRLLITGSHIIDYIGLDCTLTDGLEISYYPPSYAGYYNSTVTLTDALSDNDMQYATLSPQQTIEVNFTCPEQTLQNRALAIISRGHYYTLPEIDIKQPVIVSASVESGMTGDIKVSLLSIAYNDPLLLKSMSGNAVSWPEDATISFLQDATERYGLSVGFDGCTEKTTVVCNIASFRGEQTCAFEYVPSMGDNITIFVELDDILWNVTGVSFDKITNRYTVLKDTLLQFGIEEYYGHATASWSNYTWNFGDWTSTADINATHEYFDYGTYVVNLTVRSASPGYAFYSETKINVVDSPPVPIVDIYKELELTLVVSGRKGNSVEVHVYENDVMKYSVSVVRSANKCPDFASLEVKVRPDMDYRVELVFDAIHTGVNPTWLIMKSGRSESVYFKDFTTRHGYDQTAVVPKLIVDKVLVKNPTYQFYASESFDIDGEIVAYLWDFGDGFTSNSSAAEHKYNQNGVYVVTLTVIDEDGLATVTEREITVMAYRPPPRKGVQL